MTAWLAITVAAVASTTIGSSAHSGYIRKNGFSIAFGLASTQRALPEIVERQRRQHDSDPGDLDRPAAEMAEVGVERLRPGDREKHRAERDQADHAVAGEKADAVERIDRGEHARIGGDMPDAGDRNGDEPDQRDRTEEGRDPGGAARLHGEQRDQDHDGERHDIGIEGRRHDLQAFDRREHRQRRRDHGVAVEQRAADDAEQHQRVRRSCRWRAAPAPSAPACRPRPCCRRAAVSRRI